MKLISFFLIFIFFLSFVSATPLANDSSDIIINCTPDCSCATDTCIGSTCSDGCGGTCAGTKDCSSSGGGSTKKYQCNDGIDNDGDGLCDFNSCYINGIRLPRDPGCTSYYDDDESSEVIEEPVNETEEIIIEEIIEEPEVNETTEEIIEEIVIEPEENITGEVNASWVEEPEEESNLLIFSLILLGLITLFFGLPWLYKQLKGIKLPERKPKIKPIVQKPIPQLPKKTYPEVEQLKQKLNNINKDIINMFGKSLTYYSGILKFRSNIKNKSFILFRTYDTLNRVEKRFKK